MPMWVAAALWAVAAVPWCSAIASRIAIRLPVMPRSVIHQQIDNQRSAGRSVWPPSRFLTSGCRAGSATDLCVDGEAEPQ